MEETIRRIALLYTVEKAARGKSPEKRMALRQQDAKPVFHALEAWLAAQLNRISGKSELVKAIRYALGRMKKMRGYRTARSWQTLIVADLPLSALWAQSASRLVYTRRLQKSGMRSHG